MNVPHASVLAVCAKPELRAALRRLFADVQNLPLEFASSVSEAIGAFRRQEIVLILAEADAELLQRLRPEIPARSTPPLVLFEVGKDVTETAQSLGHEVAAAGVLAWDVADAASGLALRSVVSVSSRASVHERRRSSSVDLPENSRSRMAFYRLLEEAPAAMALYRGPTFIYDFVNKAYAKMVHRDDLLGLTVRQAFSDTEASGLEPLLRDVLETGTPFLIPEFPFKGARGSDTEQGYFAFNAVPAREENGDIFGVFVCAFDITEQVRARHREEAARRELDAIFEQVPAIVGVVSAPDQRYVLANPRLRAVYGNRPLLGRTRREAHPELADQEFPDAVDTVFRTGEPWIGHEVLAKINRFNDGVLHPGYFNAVYEPIKDKDGKVQSVVLFAIDVTDEVEARKRAESLALELRDGEERFRLLATTGADAIWRAHPDGRVFGLPGWTALTGQSIEASYGRGWLQMVHPDDRPRMNEAWDFASHDESRGLRVVLRLRRPDGSYLWARLDGVAQRGADGIPREWLGTVRDITDQKRAEDSLRLLAAASGVGSQALDVRAVLATLSGVIIPEFADLGVVDLLGDNGAFERIALAPKDGPLAELAKELEKHPPTMTPGGSPILAVDRTAITPVIGEEGLDAGGSPELAALRRKAGVHSVVVSPLYARNRRLGSIALALTSPGRRFEETDRAFVDELVRRVALAIDNAQLFRAAELERKRSEEANRSKDEFLAVVSHELRTPLTSMLGWVHLLRGGSLPEARRGKALETIERNARAQARLVEDLLDVSRIMEGKLRLELEHVDLADVVRAAVETVTPAAEAREIGLDIQLDSQTPVRGDPNRLQQVVWNLVSNAIKFTPTGGRVSVRTESTGDLVRVSVRDNGQGISTDFLPYVFERFRQADTGSTRKSGGLGLGLAIVRHLIEMHGGSVRAESEGLGQGATFVVELPRSRANAAAPSSSATLVAPGEKTPTVPLAAAASLTSSSTSSSLPNGHGNGHANGNDHSATGSAPDSVECPPALLGKRVLIVDDESDSRELVRDMLARFRIDSTAVGSAAEARGRLQHERYDVVLSDIAMPGEDGYAFVRRLHRLNPGDRRLPAVAMTAYAEFMDGQLAAQAGFDGHVVKPLHPDELIAALSRAVSNSHPPH